MSKPSGGIRQLGIPTIADRVTQVALLSQLAPTLELHLRPWVHGYRPRRNAVGAVEHLRQQVRERRWLELLKVDIESLFDRIDHDHLARASRWLCADPIWLALERRWRARWSYAPGRGIPQGAPLSPMLANLVLHHGLDVPFERARLAPHGSALGIVGVIRYADDVVVVSQARGGALLTLRWIESVLGRTGLRLGHNKVHHLIPAAGVDRLTVLGLPVEVRPGRNGGWKLDLSHEHQPGSPPR